MPSASGFIQVNACQTSGIAGVSCDIPSNSQLFATGMNGDEDLGEDIQMKGEPFHFAQSMAQWNPLEVATPFADLPTCTGTNGPVFVNCKRTKCSGTNGPMDGPASSGCEQEQVTSIPHYNETLPLADLTRPPVISPRLMLSPLLLLIPANNLSTSNLEMTPSNPRSPPSKSPRKLVPPRVLLRMPPRPNPSPLLPKLSHQRKSRFWRPPSLDLTLPSMPNSTEIKKKHLMG